MTSFLRSLATDNDRGVQGEKRYPKCMNFRRLAYVPCVVRFKNPECILPAAIGASKVIDQDWPYRVKDHLGIST